MSPEMVAEEPDTTRFQVDVHRPLQKFFRLVFSPVTTTTYVFSSLVNAPPADCSLG